MRKRLTLTVTVDSSDPMSPTEAASLWYIRLREAPDDHKTRISFNQWCKENPLNEQAWVSVMRAAQVMQQMGQAEFSGTSNTVHFRSSIPPKRRRHFSGWYLGGAFSLSVAACLALFILRSDISIRWRADAYTTTAETRTLTLSDGSSIVLAPMSAVKLNIYGKQRTVTLLQGEALFTVQHDPNRPFRVETNDAIATDIGTVFDVALTKQGTIVAVREGKSHVQALTHSLSAAVLCEGQWAHIMGQSLQQGKENAERIGMWRDGLLLVEKGTLSTFVAALQPWQPGVIVVLDKKLGKLAIGGVYDLHQPMQALDLALKPYGVHVYHLSRWLTVVSRL